MLISQTPRHAAPSAKPAATLSGETFGMLINLSGRRRFTSQRLVLYAVLASQAHDNALATARETLALFTDAHTALVKGSDISPGIFCHELEDAYFGRSRGDEQIRDFISLAGRALDAIEGNMRQAPTLLQELIAQATPLLATLNRITQVYEELSRRHAQQLKRQLHGIMTDIEAIAKQARMVSFNAQIVAARAGNSGKEFSVVASVLSDITTEIDSLVQAALNAAV
ncbi:Type IV pili methyl-accepting chemotaxis transducer N-term [Noviherbaspirillum humi]|uniref:Type IV pili methyl-accepting chemotaxis transducer N-term n=1 Tax=Noviherbaspirillum humi TaxID=1688639 RepID=A0A239J872_9BURK|nr:methyl-accepting chemotaxis protein [Noviherbaspirillum humi]SNT01989.1 Type IV pili methyl-accepting chemotaxis transducer N-term [Noviherbaspirillum humi]